MNGARWTGSDESLVRSFEAASLPNDSFGHVEHVRVAWWYVRRYPVLEAIERFGTAPRRFAAAHGARDRYHETMTWAYLCLVNERAERTPELDRWADFAEAHPDLLTFEGGPLDAYYRPATLRSELARRVFVLPDAGLPDGARADAAPIGAAPPDTRPRDAVRREAAPPAGPSEGGRP